MCVKMQMKAARFLVSEVRGRCSMPKKPALAERETMQHGTSEVRVIAPALILACSGTYRRSESPALAFFKDSVGLKDLYDSS